MNSPGNFLISKYGAAGDSKGKAVEWIYHMWAWVRKIEDQVRMFNEHICKGVEVPFLSG